MSTLRTKQFMLDGSRVFEKNLKEEESSQDSTSDDPIGTKGKRKHFVKRFRKEWMDEPVFADWLMPLPNQTERCFCSVCKCVLLAGHSELEKHAAGKKHCMAMELKTVERLNEEELEIKEALLSNTAYGTVRYASSESQQESLLLREAVEPSSLQTPKTVKVVGATTRHMAKGPSILRAAKPLLKRKVEFSPQEQVHSRLSFPDRPEASKLIRIKSDTDEDDFDDEEDDEDDLSHSLPGSDQLLREIRAELAYSEKKFISQKLSAGDDDISSTNGRVRDVDEAYRQVAEKELEARLSMIEEQRRHEVNIYKLRILEMEAKVRLTETEAMRAHEIHQLRTKEIKDNARYAEAEAKRAEEVHQLRVLELEASVRLAEAEAKRGEELNQLRTAHLHMQMVQSEQDEYMVSPVAGAAENDQTDASPAQ